MALAWEKQYDKINIAREKARIASKYVDSELGFNEGTFLDDDRYEMCNLLDDIEGEGDVDEGAEGADDDKAEVEGDNSLHDDMESTEAAAAVQTLLGHRFWVLLVDKLNLKPENHQKEAHDLAIKMSKTKKDGGCSILEYLKQIGELQENEEVKKDMESLMKECKQGFVSDEDTWNQDSCTEENLKVFTNSIRSVLPSGLSINQKRIEGPRHIQANSGTFGGHVRTKNRFFAAAVCRVIDNVKAIHFPGKYQARQDRKTARSSAQVMEDSEKAQDLADAGSIPADFRLKTRTEVGGEITIIGFFLTLGRGRKDTYFSASRLDEAIEAHKEYITKRCDIVSAVYKSKVCTYETYLELLSTLIKSEPDKPQSTTQLARRFLCLELWEKRNQRGSDSVSHPTGRTIDALGLHSVLTDLISLAEDADAQGILAIVEEVTIQTKREMMSAMALGKARKLLTGEALDEAASVELRVAITALEKLKSVDAGFDTALTLVQ